VQFADFDRFRDSYTDQVDPLRFLVSRAIKNAVKRAGELDAFVGLLGQEYLPEPCFIVILRTDEDRQLQTIADLIAKDYREHNLGLLPTQVRDGYIKNQQQKHQDSSPQFRQKLQAQLQQFLPQPEITVWKSQVPDDFYAFPDLHEAIYTLTHAKPNEMRMEK